MAYYSKLTDRKVLRVRGTDGRDFLQGIITNDMAKLTPDKLLFAALLTPQGKLLFDFMLWQDQAEKNTDETILIDTDADNAALLAKKLAFYKLRADVIIEITDLPVYAIWGDNIPNALPQSLSALFLPDPRKAALGVRHIGSLTKPNDLQSLTEAPLADYHAHRIACAVAQGAAEIIAEQNFPLEYNFDTLNGIDFQKGCFIGQEVSSRIHRRGNIRKKIHLVTADTELAPAQPVMAHIKEKEPNKMRQVGDIRAVAKQKALALLRQDSLTENLFVNDTPLQILTNDT